MTTRARLRGVRAFLVLALAFVGCSKTNPAKEPAEQRDPEVSNPAPIPNVPVDPLPAPVPSHDRTVPEPVVADAVDLFNGLIALLRNPDPSEALAPSPHPAKPAANESLNGLIARLRDPDAHERVKAVRELGEKGASAHPAIDDLIPLLADPDAEVQTQAAGAVVAIGRAKTSGLVDFSATWCGPCRTMKPIVERLKGEGLPVMMVDVDKYPRLSTQFAIRFVPTFITIRDDKEAGRSTGATSEAALRDMLKGLDKPGTARPPLGLKDSAACARVMALLLALTGEDEWIKFLAEAELTSQPQAASVLAHVALGTYPERVRLGALDGLFLIHRDRKVPESVVALLKERAASEKESVNLRGSASVALHGLKAGDPSIVPSLKAALTKGTTPGLRERAAEALGELRVIEAVPALTDALDDDSGGTRQAAVKALRVLGGHSEPAVPRLIKMYGKDPESELGAEIKQTLQEIVPSARDVSPALIAALRSDQPPVRLLAVELLNAVDDAQAATASLQALLDDAEPGIRIQAAIALQRLGQTDAKVLKALVASLGEEKENYEASEALRSEGQKIAPRLVERLVDPKSTPELRLRVVRIFGGVDQPGRAALATLKTALSSDAPDVRSCAGLALVRRDREESAPVDPALIDALLAGLKATNPELKRECAEALGNTRSPTAVAPLVTLVRRNKELRETAALSLSQLPRDEKTVGQLIALLKEPTTRSAAARALSNLSEYQETAAGALTTAFRTADQEERFAIGDALQSLGKPGMTQLVALFEDATAKEEVRLAALALVGRGEDARELVLKLDKYLKNPSERVRMRVAIALAYQRTDADVTDVLLAALEKDDEGDSLRYEAQAALAALGTKAAGSVDRLIGWAKGPDANRRNVAINLLASVGRDSPKALSALVALLKSAQDPDTRRNATHALSAFENRGAELIKVLADPAYSRLDVLASLRQLGRRGQAAREALVKCLEDKDRAVAVAAALALASVDPKSEAAVPVLIEGVRSADREIRNQAVSALGQFGPLAKSAVPELIRALPAAETRSTALYALARIGPDAVAAVEPLVRFLNGREGYAAASALGAIGPAAAPAVPRLLRMLQNERTAIPAAMALGQIGGDAKQAVPLLVAKLGDKDQLIPACRALGCVGHLDLDRTLPALRKVASDPDPEIRAVAVVTLGQLKSPKTLDDLFAALRDPKLPVRVAAVNALGQSGSEAAVAKLAEVLEAKEPDLRQQAAWALGNIGPKAEAAVPALIKTLSDKETQRSAIYALGRIGTAAAVAPLVELLDKADLRSDAAYALGQMGPAAKAALPKLRALAKDRDPAFARAVRTATDRIEGKAAPTDDDGE